MLGTCQRGVWSLGEGMLALPSSLGVLQLRTGLWAGQPGYPGTCPPLTGIRGAHPSNQRLALPQHRGWGSRGRQKALCGAGAGRYLWRPGV